MTTAHRTCFGATISGDGTLSRPPILAMLERSDNRAHVRSAGPGCVPACFLVSGKGEHMLRHALGAAFICLVLVACGGGGSGGGDNANTTVGSPAAATAVASVDTATQASGNGDAPTEAGGSTDGQQATDVRVPLAVGSSAETTASDIGTLKVTINQIIDPATTTATADLQPASGTGSGRCRSRVSRAATRPRSGQYGVTLAWTLQTTDGATHEQVFFSGVGDDLDLPRGDRGDQPPGAGRVRDSQKACASRRHRT